MSPGGRLVFELLIILSALLVPVLCLAVYIVSRSVIFTITKVKSVLIENVFIVLSSLIKLVFF